ncbi:hypothetical protein V1527DRAFT_456274, partial [Lipomyces starkeyi]
MNALDWQYLLIASLFPVQHYTVMDHITAAVNNPYPLYVGMVLDSVDQARQFVHAYAIQSHFAVKNGFVNNKDRTLLLLCKCAKKPFNARQVPMTKGTQGDNCLVRPKVVRNMLCDCPWRVRFKKQLNDS